MYECELPGMGKKGNTYSYKGNLGAWLNNQRRAKQGQGLSKISAEQLAQLQVLVDEGQQYFHIYTV